MTVCIAATCFDGGKSRIVLCHDWQGTYASIGSSESSDKQKYIGKNWMALLSGSLPQAEELCAILDGTLGDTPISQIAALTKVREGVFTYKSRLIDQYLRGTYGINFNTLRDSGKSIYPETLLQQIHAGIIDLDLGVDLLITGFVEDIDSRNNKKFLQPCIIQVSASGSNFLDVSPQTIFACIGEGAASASASLLYRELGDDWSLKQTAYAVYEAKRLAEILPSVGGATSLYVQSEDEPLRYINTEGFKKCDKLFDSIGPKQMTKKTLENAASIEDFVIDSDDDSSRPSDSQTSKGQP